MHEDEHLERSIGSTDTSLSINPPTLIQSFTVRVYSRARPGNCWVLGKYVMMMKHVTLLLQALANHSVVLKSQMCRSGWSTAMLRTVPGLRSLLDIPVFLRNETRAWEMAPPLGLQGSEEALNNTLRALPHSGLPSAPEKCRRCMVVGSGGVLHGKQLGSHIDKYDVIIRYVLLL